MFGDMMDKLQGMKQQMEEIKTGLSNQKITEEMEGIKVTVDGNRKVLDVSIDSKWSDDLEAVEDMIVIVLNKALERAEATHDQEMAKNAGGMLGGFPGM